MFGIGAELSANAWRSAIRQLIVLGYLKADPETRSIPICAISAYDVQDESEEPGPLPFDSYLRKPIDPQQVVAEVRSWIGPAEEGPSQTPLSAG